MLIYKNNKTGAYIQYEDDIETFSYLFRIMKYQENKIRKEKMQELANVLKVTEITKWGIRKEVE